MRGIEEGGGVGRGREDGGSARCLLPSQTHKTTTACTHYSPGGIRHDNNTSSANGYNHPLSFCRSSPLITQTICFKMADLAGCPEVCHSSVSFCLLREQVNQVRHELIPVAGIQEKSWVLANRTRSSSSCQAGGGSSFFSSSHHILFILQSGVSFIALPLQLSNYSDSDL